MRKLLLPAILLTAFLGIALAVFAADAPAGDSSVKPVVPNPAGQAPTVPAPANAKPAPKSGPVSPEDINGVDFSGLSEEQKKLAVDLLNSYTCDCGCSPPMKIAACRRDDPKCSRSLGMATQVVSLIKQGKSRD